MNRLAVYRAIWGFLVFIPFCWAWGVNNFTLFSVAGTLYFVPMHAIFDRVFVQKGSEERLITTIRITREGVEIDSESLIRSIIYVFLTWCAIGIVLWAPILILVFLNR